MAKIYGTNGDNYPLPGTAYADTIYGDLSPKSGKLGALGRDLIEAGWGNDTVYGDLHTLDSFSPFGGRDIIDGGGGDDWL